MFQLNLALEQEETSTICPTSAPAARDQPIQEVSSAAEAEDQHVVLEQFRVSDLCLWKGRIASDRAAELLQLPRVVSSDLIAGCYEGGFKLWEGCIDLTQYLVQRYGIAHDRGNSTRHSEFSGRHVLELGAGHGLPGVASALAGAEVVMFQDFNREVLTALTIPTVAANVSRLPASQKRPVARFMAGSWAAMPAWLRSTGLANSFDIILTAETIYNSASSMDLYQTLTQALKPGGIALVAAKTHYFGVGGGSLAFRRLVERQQPQLMVAQTVAEVGDGSSVLREILELRFASAS